MKLNWLEDLVKEGQVSKEAADVIYRDCQGMAKSASTLGPAEMKKLVGGMMDGAGQMLGMGALYLAGKPLISSMGVRADVQKAKESLAYVKQDPQLSAMKDKVDARFKELMEHAPAVAVNKDMALRLIKRSINKGFSESDIDKLQQMQASAGAGLKASMSLSDAVDHSEGVKNKFMKSASAEETISPEMAGSIAFDAYQLASIGIEKNAGITDKVKKLWNSKFGDFLAFSLASAGVGAGISAAAGAANHIKDKLDQKNFANKLEQSYMTALRESDAEREMLKDNPTGARKAFETLVHFAPNVAVEPRAARSFIQKMLAYEDQALQPQDVKDLVEIERNFASASSKQSPFFSAFSQTGKLVGLDKSISQATTGAMKPYVDHYEGQVQAELSTPEVM